MGRTHCLTGAAVGAWTLPAVAAVADLPWSGQVAWVAAAAGFALAPDIDHPSSHAANMWGAPTRAVAKLTHGVFGHRGLTHHLLLAPAVFAGLVWAANMAPYGSAAMFGVAACLAWSALDPVPDRRFTSGWNIAFAAFCGYIAHRYDVDLTLLPYAAAVGVIVHIVGDALTTRGVFGLFDTGSRPEHVIAWGASAATLIYPLTVLL